MGDLLLSINIKLGLFEMSGTVKKFTMAEVKEHNTATDLWTVIHDKVYDVTKFQNEVSVFLCNGFVNLENQFCIM